MTVIDDIDAPGGVGWSVSSVGGDMSANKYLLKQAVDQVGVDWEMWVLILAMGMLETQHLTSAERDASKDNSGLAANVSGWNLSLDLVQQVGTYNGDPWDLNRTEHIPDVVRVIRDGIAKWGINSLLNFVRAGRTGFQDGVSYGAADYRDTIKSMANAIRSDHSLLYDDRRVNVYLQHV